MPERPADDEGIPILVRVWLVPTEPPRPPTCVVVTEIPPEEVEPVVVTVRHVEDLVGEE